MNVLRIERLSSEQDDAYEALLHSQPTSLLFASSRYRNLLQTITGAEDYYLGAFQGDELIGALPGFLKRNSRYGAVLNSLPFVGSNGGFICDPRFADQVSVRRELLEAFHALAREQRALTSTIITNPLDKNVSFYEKCTGYTWRDERIGQITSLPPYEADAADRLMGMFHPKTRNAIRKAQKSSLRVWHSDSAEALAALYQLHSQNMAAIGGPPKPWRFFESLPQLFRYDTDYRVYVAERDQRVIAALLVFFYNRTAEYYTPATQEAYRIYQPMCLLIFEAMQEAVRRRFLYWNWGGTGLTMTGVYKFKSRWGTQDRRYFYYVVEHADTRELRCLDRRTIVAEYPFLYVLPFSALLSSSPPIKVSMDDLPEDTVSADEK